MVAKKTKDKTPAAPPVGTPVTERGVDLLNRMAREGGLYLTKEEAQEQLDAGNLHVNMQDTQGDRALCMLTNAGQSLVTEKPAAVTSSANFEIDDDVPMPTASAAKRGGKRGSKYPFDKLEVGKSFHVPKTDEVPDPVSALASSITGARRRYSEPVLDDNKRPIMEQQTVKTYQLDGKGKRVKNAEGKWVSTGSATVTVQKTKALRDFFAVAVGPGTAYPADPKGAGARVFRKL